MTARLNRRSGCVRPVGEYRSIWVEYHLEYRAALHRVPVGRCYFA